MRFAKVTENKKRYLDLLLLADESEEMVDRYLDRGDMFLLEAEGHTLASLVLTREGPDAWELKSLAVVPLWQGKGWGRAAVAFARGYCRGRGGRRLQVGTGDSPATLGFYQRCGFSITHREKDFFTRNYPAPIWDEAKGGYLRDMVYLEMGL